MAQAIRIGGASGYWGESLMATPQLLASGDLDYLVYDYLAEVTMSIMARARAKDPTAGYATDFITGVLKPHLPALAASGVKVLANAGGVNPQACAEAARALVAEAGLDLRVAVVTGDDLLGRADELAAAGTLEMYSGDAFPPPDQLASVNAYFGAFPIAAALQAGADIVITGRSVDSAVTLGACIHAFGWRPEDSDLLAAGSLAGHIIECGPQASGGNFTDWQQVGDSADLANIGYPIVEIAADGTFTCGKPAGTGGLVSVGTVSEQMLYEIGDPRSYVLPDVVCDFSLVEIAQQGPDLVSVSGAVGRGAPATYKVSATYYDGFRAGTLMSFVGVQAAAKARTYGAAATERARAALRRLNLGDFDEVSLEVIGGGSQYGEQPPFDPQAAREVVLKLAVRHRDMRGAGTILKEASGLGLATPPGLSGFAGGRARPSPIARLFSFLIDKQAVPVAIDLDGVPVPYSPAPAAVETAAVEPAAVAAHAPPPPPETTADMTPVPLLQLAWGRSGDKGNKANIGIIARRADYLPYIWAALDEEAVRRHFAHFLAPGSAVQRFLLPGSHAINYLLHEALGGGGIASLRNDPQGKAYAQILLDFPVPVPAALAAAAESS